MAARRNSAPQPEVTPAESEVVTTDQFEAEAKPVAEGYTVVIGPSGIASTVPDSIVEALVDSGYKVK